MLGDKWIVIQVGIAAADAIDFLRLAGREPQVWIETATVGQQPLPA